MNDTCPGGGVLPIMGRVGISLIEVYKREGKSVFPSIKHLKGLIEEFMAVKKSRKVRGSVTYSNF